MMRAIFSLRVFIIMLSLLLRIDRIFYYYHVFIINDNDALTPGYACVGAGM